jgi:tubulin-specific chaperone A
MFIRLRKECQYYEKETKDNEATLQEMKDQGRDFYDIKKFQEVLDESIMMIPDSKRRFQQALEDLELFLNDSEIQEGEWYEKARSILASAAKVGEVHDTVKQTDLNDLGNDEAF